MESSTIRMKFKKWIAPIGIPCSWYFLSLLQGCHNDLGHLGIEQTIEPLRDHFYWPEMMEDRTRHIKQCKRCSRFKALPDKAPMENVDATYPMELVHMDYLMIEANEGSKDVHILMITDHFTWYAQATSQAHRQPNAELKIYGTNLLSIMGFLRKS